MSISIVTGPATTTGELEAILKSRQAQLHIKNKVMKINMMILMITPSHLYYGIEPVFFGVAAFLSRR